MVQPSRAYTRLLNTLIDGRVATAPRRSPWFHMTPDERTFFLAEVDRRLLEIQQTTLNVLAAQRYALDNHPDAIDEHLDVLRQRRQQMKAQSPYRRALDDDIRLYTHQRDAQHGFESAWRKALRLLQAGNGLVAPCPTLLVRLQRLVDLCQRKYDGDRRVVLFARHQGWLAVAERYRRLLQATPEQMDRALAALSELPPDSNAMPVHLSLLLMEERPGYIRMTVALVNPSPDGFHKDLYLDQGKLVVQTNGMVFFSFGTAARSLAWQQHYRLKHEPAQRRSPTLAPIRSVLVRSALVVELMAEHVVSEHSQRLGFFSHRLEDGSRIRILNVDRKVPNQIGIEVLDDPERLSELINRYADIASFQTIALEDYATTWYNPDRDGTFLSHRELERSIGFSERLYLLELPVDGEYQDVTPFERIDARGGRHLRMHELRQAYAHNRAFFDRLASLRDEGPKACPWLDSPYERAAFQAQWERLLERNHLTPGGVLPVPDEPRTTLRDIRGNSLQRMAEERSLAETLWNWSTLESLLFGLGERLDLHPKLPRLLQDGYVQCLLAQAAQELEPVFGGMPYKTFALRLLRLMVRGSLGPEQEDRMQWSGVERTLDSPHGRELRRHAILHVLYALGKSQDVQQRPDPWLLLNAQPDERPLLVGQDKYRGYHQFTADPQHSDTRLMDDLDAPIVGGVSKSICQALPDLLADCPGLPQYWRFQLAYAAFLQRNGYHSLFETLYPAALDEPPGPNAIGARLLSLFTQGAWPGQAMALILSLANSDLPAELRFSRLEPPGGG